MNLFDIVDDFLCQVCIAKNYQYAETHLSEDFVFYSLEGEKNKRQTIAFLKSYLKKHPVYSTTVSVLSCQENNIALEIYFSYKEKEKFLGFTVAENDRVDKFHIGFEIENGMITEACELIIN